VQELLVICRAQSRSNRLLWRGSAGEEKEGTSTHMIINSLLAYKQAYDT